MRNVIKQVQYMIQLYIYKMTSSRTISILAVQLFINFMYCRPVMALSDGLDYRVSPWIFPFMLSEYHYAFLFLAGMIYYFSDVPFMQHWNMYQVIRTGRRKWAVGQIGVIILQSFSMVLINIAMSVLLLCRHLEFTTEWGKLLHTAALTDAAGYYELLFPVSYDTLTLFAPVPLMLLTFFIGGLVISFMGILMFVISLLMNRIAAAAVATVMAVMIFFVENVHYLLAVKIGRFVPANWIRVANIGKKMFGNYIVPSLPWMLGVLVAGIILSGMIIVVRIRYVEFKWNRED